jgi:hypothetical protein
MDTSNSTDMDFKVAELHKSDHAEERELAADAERTICALVENLKPILIYVTSPRTFCQNHTTNSACGVRVTHKTAGVICREPDLFDTGTGRKALFIYHDGKFLRANLAKGGENIRFSHWHTEELESDQAWSQFNFADVIKGLQALLKEAETKREEHLKIISARRQKLDEIVAILKK